MRIQSKNIGKLPTRETWIIKMQLVLVLNQIVWETGTILIPQLINPQSSILNYTCTCIIFMFIWPILFMYKEKLSWGTLSVEHHKDNLSEYKKHKNAFLKFLKWYQIGSDFHLYHTFFVGRRLIKINSTTTCCKTPYALAMLTIAGKKVQHCRGSEGWK